MTRPPSLLGRRVKTWLVTETQSLGMMTTLVGGHEDPEEASHKPRHPPRPARALCAQQGSQHFTCQLHDPQSSPRVGNAHPPHLTCEETRTKGRGDRLSARGGTRAETSVSAAQPRRTAAGASCSAEPLKRAGWEEAAPGACTEELGSPPSHGPPALPTRLRNRPHTGRPSADSTAERTAVPPSPSLTSSCTRLSWAPLRPPPASSCRPVSAPGRAEAGLPHRCVPSIWHTAGAAGSRRALRTFRPLRL